MEEEPAFNPDTLGLKILKEGSAEFYSFPPEDYSDTGSSLSKAMPVFYNPIMVINRDITLLIYKAYQDQFLSKELDRELLICDLMAASGIRAIRLLQFLPSPVKIIMNDLNHDALQLIQKNLEQNQINAGYQLENYEATYYLEKSRNEKCYFDIIDIDPFGTPNVFIEHALRAVQLGGILGITATDTAVIFGIKQSACVRKYNTRSLRSTFLKEVGIRILIYFSAIRAHPHMLYIEPMLSFSSEHFVRIVLKVNKGKEGVDRNLRQFGYILWCPKCDWRGTLGMDIHEINFTCPLCGAMLDYGGPLWLGPLHDHEFAKQCQMILETTTKEILPTKHRLEKAFECIVLEDQFPIGYYNIHKLCDAMNICVGPTAKILDLIRARGFEVTRTHFDPMSIKTNMPVDQLREVLQEIAQITKMG